MNPGSITMLFDRKEKVLTIVGAFFITQKTVSVLSRNHCPLYTGILQLSVCMDFNRNPLQRKTPFRGVSILRNKKFCLKLKIEIEKLQGFILKTEALKTA